MYLAVKEKIRRVVEDASGEPVRIDDVKASLIADLCSPIAFKLAKKEKKNPAKIAEELACKIKPEGLIKRVEADKGYLNFYLDHAALSSPVLGEAVSKGDDYGRMPDKREKIVLEHTSINPSGPIHIGRLRNSLIGDCLSRVLEFNGFDVETHYYVNDVGKQIAIIAQGFQEGVEPDPAAIEEYKKYKDKEDFKVFFIYVAANKRFEEDPSFAERVQENIRKAEEGDTKALDSITGIAERCLAGQRQVYSKLGISFDFYDFESKYIRDGSVKEAIEFLKKSEYAKENENGFGLDLGCFGLERRGGLSMLARKDGTSVYLARDIAYHLEKIKQGDRLINVLGEDHKFEFLELATILSRIYGLKNLLEVVHFSFVSFEGMELSTRKGKTAPVDLLIDEAVKKAEDEIKKRGIAGTEAAGAIGLGAIKYHILKTAPLKQITFRWDEALSFEGDASPYIQYAHARCCSILEKANKPVGRIEYDSLHEHEKHLVVKIARFPEAVETAGRELKPNIIASYLYELASDFSRFYKECQVLTDEPGLRNRRLMLVDATRQVLRNGLHLLGIEALEKM